MTINITLLFLAGLAFLVLILIVLQIRTELRLKKFFKGKNGGNVEGLIESLYVDIQDLQNSRDDILVTTEDHNQRLKKSIRGVETVRFNPFKDSGSNQSFALAMVNEDGDGVIISSLYSRERMSIFAKPVKQNASEFELTHEENEALSKAQL